MNLQSKINHQPQEQNEDWDVMIRTSTSSKINCDCKRIEDKALDKNNNLVTGKND